MSSLRERADVLLGIDKLKAGRHLNISARNDLGSINSDGSLSLIKVLKRTEHKSLDV